MRSDNISKGERRDLERGYNGVIKNLVLADVLALLGGATLNAVLLQALAGSSPVSGTPTADLIKDWVEILQSNRLIRVFPGQDTQAAVDDAAARYASTGKWWGVFVHRGVDRNHTLADGVSVIFEEDIPVTRFGPIEQAMRQAQPWFLQTSAGAFALQQDDGTNDILKVDRSVRPDIWDGIGVAATGTGNAGASSFTLATDSGRNGLAIPSGALIKFTGDATEYFCTAAVTIAAGAATVSINPGLVGAKATVRVDRLFNFGGIQIAGSYVHPAAYLRYLRIPITLLLIGKYVNDPTLVNGKILTQAEIAELIVDYGFETLAHTWNHGAVGDELEFTIDNMHDELIKTKRLIESLERVPGYRAGIVRGFSESGNVVSAQYADNWANIEQDWNALIRSNYDYSQGELSENEAVISGMGFPHHRFGPGAIRGANMLTQLFRAIATPGCRARCNFHFIESIPCTFKALVDTIAAERDTGRLYPCTMSGLHTGQIHPRREPTRPYISGTGTVDTLTDPNQITMVDSIGVLVGTVVTIHRSDTGELLVFERNITVNAANVLTIDGPPLTYDGAVMLDCYYAATGVQRQLLPNGDFEDLPTVPLVFGVAGTATANTNVIAIGDTTGISVGMMGNVVRNDTGVGAINEGLVIAVVANTSVTIGGVLNSYTGAVTCQFGMHFKGPGFTFKTGTAASSATITGIADTTGLYGGTVPACKVFIASTGQELTIGGEADRLVSNVAHNTSVTLSSTVSYNGNVVLAFSDYQQFRMREMSGLNLQICQGAGAVGIESGGYPGKALRFKSALQGGGAANRGYIQCRWLFDVTPNELIIIEWDHKLVSGTAPALTVEFHEPVTGVAHGTSMRHSITPTNNAASGWTRQGIGITVPPWCTRIRLQWLDGWGTVTDYYIDNIGITRVG